MTSILLSDLVFVTISFLVCALGFGAYRAVDVLRRERAARRRRASWRDWSSDRRPL